MTSSLPDKMFDGQTGFPTPNAAPEVSGCRVFVVPDDEEWFALMMGAMLRLTQEWAWYQNGTMTPAEAAAAWAGIIDDAYERSLDSSCSTTVPAPYWDEDSGDDADDEADTESQPWYGDVVTDGVTWREQVGIWAITAFVAIAATPAAAIAFLPFANRFVLAFHQHDLGGIVRVLIDATEVGTVDTYSPTDGIASIIISNPAPAGFMALDAPQMLIVMSDEVNPAVEGTPNIQVIRKRLDQTEVTPKNIRWNSECDCVQITTDGGATWVDAPEQDPRKSTTFQVAPRSTGDIRCDSAQQMHDRIKNALDALIASSSLLQAINSVVGVASIFLLEIGIIIEAIWAVVTAIFGIGTTVLDAALDATAYDDLLCILYCEIGSDGTVNEAQYNKIITRINEDLNTVAAFAITTFLSGIGWVGLTNAGALGEVTGDCGDCDVCEWCVTIDLNVQGGNWAANHLDGSTSSCGFDWGGTLITGQGFVNVGCISLAVSLQLPAGTELTQITFHTDTGTGATPAIILTVHSDFQGTNIARYNAYDSGAIDEILAADTYLGILLQSPSGTPCGSGSQNIDRITVTGKGSAPTILVGDPC